MFVLWFDSHEFVTRTACVVRCSLGATVRAELERHSHTTGSAQRVWVGWRRPLAKLTGGMIEELFMSVHGLHCQVVHTLHTWRISCTGLFSVSIIIVCHNFIVSSCLIIIDPPSLPESACSHMLLAKSPTCYFLSEKAESTAFCSTSGHVVSALDSIPPAELQYFFRDICKAP